MESARRQNETLGEGSAHMEREADETEDDNDRDSMNSEEETERFYDAQETSLISSTA